ncbi:HPt (histidine-containing phosphotransfer) domain-containing protein [Palleronia marisminoris]|uniref:Hpt domain protein n=1 Tax=Palleronia marisminoris TaxID=315423 RepID=A0A1Y5SY94_9RHOB|nr:Hpt domain-containing protein [Palleronia marisminoris]SFH05516.1 HPt (histidine-containing phosphotransfer) domain-containing protein [Palleronia marisminoris]SLN50763.1 Hpt domain protein [Palleronia marisminoris]
MIDDTPLIDMQRLAEMRDDFGAEILPELHALFVSEAAVLVERIGAEDGADLVPLVHTLKGSAQTMGMARLVLVCKQAETALHEGRKTDPAMIAHLVEQSADAFAGECGCQIRNSDKIGSAVMSR